MSNGTMSSYRTSYGSMNQENTPQQCSWNACWRYGIRPLILNSILLTLDIQGEWFEGVRYECYKSTLAILAIIPPSHERLFNMQN